ncbi:16077_t:CDS:1, partial [Dentiscutata erythropus]
LVELKVEPLHSLEDYVEALQSLTNIGEARTYLENQILVAPIDYPGQLNVRRAVNHRIKLGDSSGVPRQVLHI